MPRGLADIVDLRLEVLQNFIETFMAPPQLLLSNLFSSSISPSSSVKWESREGSRGMTPFVPPGSPAPQTSPSGVAAHSAEAAFWKEKMYFDEEFLNNLRKEGTEGQYLDAQARLARELASMVNRSNRRKEWMFAQMLFAGSFAYAQSAGPNISVDYDVRTDHLVTLGAAYKWNTGTSRNIITDIITAKKKIRDDCGAIPNYAVCNSTVLKYLALDPTIQTLLQKSAFGSGDLFSGNVNEIVGANPKVIGALLDIDNLVVYDEMYEARGYLTAAVTGASTVAISVEDSSDFVAAETLRFHDVSANTYEDETIASVDNQANTVTVSTAPTASFKAGEDYVSMVKYFVPETKFAMFSSTVDGQQIAEYKKAPFALDRHYGVKVDRKEMWDPEGIYIRVQDKGLPILYQRDAMYVLTVA